MRIALAVIACALAAGSARAQSASTDRSLDRIRGALAQPSLDLTPQDRTPDFRIEINERQWWDAQHFLPLWHVDVGWQPRHRLPPSPFGSQALISVDLLQVATAIGESLQRMRYAHAQASARDEVQLAIASWCAAHPDADAQARAICSANR